MAVAYVNNQFSRVVGTSFSPTMPGSIAADNLLVMVAFVWQSGGPTLNTPSGWTKAIDGNVSFGTGVCRRYVFIKKAVASEPSPTLTPSASAFMDVLILQYSGQDLTTPQDGTAASSAALSGTSLTTPAITTSQPNSLILYFMNDDLGGASTPTVPAGATQRYNTFSASTDFRIVVSDKLQATAATVAATTHSRTAGTRTAITATMAVRVAGAAAPAFVPRITVVN